MTIQELLVRDGFWKEDIEHVKPNHAGLCFHNDGGKGRESQVTYNGQSLPGIFHAEVVADVDGLCELKLSAYARRIDMKDFKGITNLHVYKHGRALGKTTSFGGG